MKNKLFVYLTIGISLLAINACDNSNKKSENNSNDSSKNKDNIINGMHASMKGMESMKMTGNFDCDFANMMIIHHQGAIEMSEFELENGTDADMKAMAQNIIKTQTNEIEEMHKIAKNFKVVLAANLPSQDHQSLTDGMKEMMEKMHKVPSSGNPDKDFVAMMIPHHEAAVKMAKDQIDNGQNEALKLMAQKMVDKQNEEIEVFKNWLANRN